MKPSLTLIGFLLYTLIGVCPMQVSAMTMQDMGDMKMDMEMMDMSKHMHHEMIMNHDACGTCLRSIDDYSLRKVQPFVLKLMIEQPIVLSDTAIEVVDLNVTQPVQAVLARAGPGTLAPDITKTIVLRT